MRPHPYVMTALYRHCGISKQGHYQALKRQAHQQQKQELIVGLILQMREIHPAMGLRTLYELCQPEAVGRDGFIRIGLAYGLRVKVVRNQSRTTFSSPASRYPNLLTNKVLDNINQLWSSDLTYVKVGPQHYYIVLMLDVYSRRIVGYAVSDNMRADNNLRALKMALRTRAVRTYGDQLIHHSDRGGQYISQAYTSLLAQRQIRISMCNEVYENAHIERVNGTIKNQYLSHWEITNSQQLQAQVKRAIDTYNTQRPHSALGGLSPVAFEQHIKEQAHSQRPKVPIWTADESKNHNPEQCIIQF